MTLGYSTKLVGLVEAGDADKVGVKLGRICILRNYSVNDVAEYFGVSRMTVYRWFRGHAISPKYLRRVQDLLAKFE